MEESENTSGVKAGMVGKGVGEARVGLGVSVANAIVGRRKNIGVAVAVGTALCVSAKAVLTVDMAVCMISSWFIMGVSGKRLQDASMTATRNKAITVLPERFTSHSPLMFCLETPNGL